MENWKVIHDFPNTGLNDSNIVKCCKGIKKTCGGYIWAYV
mgnify:CR=1 FL=1